MEHVTTAVGVGEAVAPVREQHHPAIRKPDQPSRRVGRDQSRWTRVGPDGSVVREGLVETAELGPDEHPDAAILQLENNRFDRAIRSD